MNHGFRLLSFCVVFALWLGDLATGRAGPVPKETSRSASPQDAAVTEGILRRALGARGGEETGHWKQGGKTIRTTFRRVEPLRSR